MQQQQQQQPGSQYGAQSPTDLTPFPSRPQFSAIHPEAPSPISSRPPPVQNFGELATTAAGGFHEDDALAAGEDAERGGTPGNRWPREETLALLKIRSEMDAAFKDASLKGPLWENVSRKLGELGYIRSAKKCKEKFENVHKYYKRTKEGRAGRQDGKSYRFFTQLEALHTTSGGVGITGSGSGSSTPTAMSNPIPALPAAVAPIWASIQPPPPSIIPPLPPPPSPLAPATTPAPSTVPQPQSQSQPQPHTTAATGISFSSDTFTSSSYESDDEDTEEGGASAEGRKRKRSSGGPGGSRKMMAFFEGLMMQVMQKQEAMQQRFLETIEKRENDRTAREEAWKRQEMVRLNREHEMLAQERAVAASRDAALISFLQKIGGGQAIQVSPTSAPSPRPPSVQQTPPSRPAVVHITPPPPPPPPPPPQPTQQETPKETQQPQQPIQHQHISPAPPPAQLQQQQAPRQSDEIVIAQNHPSSSCTELVPVPEQHEIVATPRGAFELGVSPSRWPKSEVHALIKLRSGLEGRYQEAGPKGPLWEEISSGMQRLGYNRSSKRCKEKWENINKYFKKVKESNKKRPEDAKTCPYFHQLDALYRKKNLGSTSNPGYNIENNPQAPPPPSQPLPPSQAQPIQATQPIQIQQIQPETGRKSEAEKNAGNSGNPGGGIQIQTSNGGLPSSFFDGGTAAMNKPEDIMKELMEQQHRRQAAMNNYNKMEQPHTDHTMYQDDEDDDDEDDEDDEDANMVYKMQFERQNVGNGGGGGGNASAKPAAPTTAGSFLGMVQ